MKKTRLFVILGFLLFFSRVGGGAESLSHRGIGGGRSVPAFLRGIQKEDVRVGLCRGEEYKYYLHNAKGEQEALKKLAAQLLKDNHDVIVTSSTTATAPMAKATAGTKIPVVFLSAGNPLSFVKSYSSSGNNLTGISSSSLDLVEKRLELLKEMVPTLKRVIFIINPKGRITKRISAWHEKQQKDWASGEAILLSPDVPFVAVTEDLAQQAIKERLPVVGPNVQTVKRGQLAGYSSDYYSLGQQGAMLVEKILKGARPTDLPIEQPSRLSLVINLKTAKALGLRIPKEILLRADEVIE
jgi:putative tryptophan/tyrosine transport system substrate-binding protein